MVIPHYTQACQTGSVRSMLAFLDSYRGLNKGTFNQTLGAHKAGLGG